MSPVPPSSAPRLEPLKQRSLWRPSSRTKGTNHISLIDFKHSGLSLYRLVTVRDLGGSLR